MPDATVDGKVGVDVAVVVPLIAQVTAVVEAAVVAVQAIAHLNANALLTHNGTVISLQVCAQLIADVLVVRLSPSFDFFGRKFNPSMSCQKIFLILQVIVTALGSIQAAVVVNLFVNLG